MKKGFENETLQCERSATEMVSVEFRNKVKFIGVEAKAVDE